MADVKVGDVRREKPRSMRGGPLIYLAAPFRVLRFEGRKVAGCVVPVAVAVALDGRRERAKRVESVAECPLWPSEHEEYRNAKGYEVKT